VEDVLDSLLEARILEHETYERKEMLLFKVHSLYLSKKPPSDY
jgi:hypothetical protein